MNNIYTYFNTVKQKQIDAPLTVQFEIHDKCVAKCITCGYRNQNISTQTDYTDIIRSIDNLAMNGTRTIRLTGGEPIIAPRFVDIVNCCLKNKLNTSITTTLLTKQEDNIRILANKVKIKLSLSTVGDEYYNFFQIDNSFFDIVKNNLDLLKSLKKRFSVNYTIFDKNCSEESLSKFIEFISDYKPFYVTFFPALNYSEQLPEKQIIETFKKLKSSMNFKSNAKTIEKHFDRRKPRRSIICHINKFHAHIKRNGDVYPCCMSGGEIGQNLQTYFVLGNIFAEDIKSIYHRNYDKFKDINLCDNEICKECTQRYLSINKDYQHFIEDKKFSDI